MLAKTHLAFGLLLALVIAPFIAAENKIIFFALVLFGAILPDIDKTDSSISNKIPILPDLLSIITKHRGIFHSIFFALIIPILIGFFTTYIYGFALFIGYVSHLLIDSFTKQGINFLHPVANLHLSGFIETGTAAELIIFLIILAGIAFKLI